MQIFGIGLEPIQKFVLQSMLLRRCFLVRNFSDLVCLIANGNFLVLFVSDSLLKFALCFCVSSRVLTGFWSWSRDGVFVAVWWGFFDWGFCPGQDAWQRCTLLKKSDCAYILRKAIELSSCTKLQEKSNGGKLLIGLLCLWSLSLNVRWAGTLQMDAY